MAAAPQREFALIKVSDDQRGEQFWIIRLDLVRGSIGRSETSVDLATACAQLDVLGCAAGEIEDLVRSARDAFSGVFSSRPH